VHRSVLKFSLWPERNRFLRKGKHFVSTAEHRDFLREPIRRAHSPTSGMLPALTIGNVELEIEMWNSRRTAGD